jgi:hypothetical protein
MRADRRRGVLFSRVLYQLSYLAAGRSSIVRCYRLSHLASRRGVPAPSPTTARLVAGYLVLWSTYPNPSARIPVTSKDSQGFRIVPKLNRLRDVATVAGHWGVIFRAP